MLLRLPLPNPRLQYLVRRGRLVNQVGYPGVPAWFVLGGVEFFVAVVDPAGSYWIVLGEWVGWMGVRRTGELLFEILVVFVAVAVCCYEGAGFGVACRVGLVVSSLVRLGKGRVKWEHTHVLSRCARVSVNINWLRRDRLGGVSSRGRLPYLYLMAIFLQQLWLVRHPLAIYGDTNFESNPPQVAERA